MKALEILKHKWIAGNVIYDEDTDRHTRYLKYDDRLIDEAITELEELNNRSCGSCNYYTGTVCYFHEGWCDEIGVVHPTMEKNDCCNRYEKKDSK